MEAQELEVDAKCICAPNSNITLFGDLRCGVVRAYTGPQEASPRLRQVKLTTRAVSLI